MRCAPKFAACLLALLLALPFSVAGAQQPGSSANTWRLSGKVVDAGSGQALARCVVAINLTRDAGQSRSVETADDGRFAFAGLVAGKYELRATRRGYLTQSYQEHENFSTAIAVGPELISEGLTFNLTPQAVFYGLVSDEAGEPIRRAQVHLYDDRLNDGVRSTRERQAVFTDDRGMYEIPNIRPGNYFLSASAQPWYAYGGIVMPSHGPQPNQESSPLDVAYPTTFYPNAVDSDEATPIPIRGGERIEANMTLTAQRAMHLHLFLARPQEGGWGVSLAQPVFGQLEPMPRSMQMNSDGGMDISGVLPGRYEVTVSHSEPGHLPELTHFSAAVAEGATQLSADTGAEEVTVSGKVASLDSKIAFAGISLVGSHPRRDYRAKLNKAGEFTLQVVPGEYEVIGQIPQMYLASVSSPNAVVKGRMLQVESGSAPQLEIVAGTGYGQIAGRAEHAGHPASGVMVLLAPEDARDNKILFRRDQSDSDGTFLLFGIIPGRYRLLAIEDGWDLDWADVNVLAAYLKKSLMVRVRAHDKLEQTVEVQSR